MALGKSCHLSEFSFPQSKLEALYPVSVDGIVDVPSTDVPAKARIIPHFCANNYGSGGKEISNEY